jgi:putative oxidoreductase
MFKEIGFTHVVVLAALIVAVYRVRKALPGSELRAWHERHVSPRARARWHRILLLEFIEVVLAGVFLFVGGAKLIGRPDMVALFHDIGVGQWFRYVTGAVEVTGAALLVIPLLSGGSAILLGGVMVVATLIELFVLHRPPVAALACLSGHTFVAWARMSKRHRSWRHAESMADHPTAVSTGSMKARWKFPRVNAGHDRLRPAASLYVVVVNRAGSVLYGLGGEEDIVKELKTLRSNGWE